VLEVFTVENHGARDSGLYVDTYAPILQQLAAVLPMETGHRATTPIWAAVCRWFYHHIEKGFRIGGLCDSPYELFMLVGVLGALLSLKGVERSTWMMVGAVVFLQVVPSAFVAGIGPRYSVPIQPLMNLFAAVVLSGLLRIACRGVRLVVDAEFYPSPSRNVDNLSAAAREIATAGASPSPANCVG
jgi:hypothetical protein